MTIPSMNHNTTLETNQHFVLISVVPLGDSPKVLPLDQQKARWQVVEQTANFIRDELYNDNGLRATTHVEREIKPKQYGIQLTLNGADRKLRPILEAAEKRARKTGISLVSNLLEP